MPSGVRQAVVVNAPTQIPNTEPMMLALFNPDGTPKVIANKAAAQVNSVAVDVPTLVADFNALLTKLRAAGVMA